MNTAAALTAGDKVATMGQGIALANIAIDNGTALHKVEELVKFSQSSD